MEAINKIFRFDFEAFILITISGIGIYLLIIIYTRIFGKRSFSKMSSFDFAMTVGVGSMLATTVLSESVNLIDGALGLLVIYFMQLGVAYGRRSAWFRHIVDNDPSLLMDGDKILWDNMRKARITERDIRSKLREANITDLAQVKAVVFETTGTINVLQRNDDKKIQDWLLKDVKI